VTMVAGPAVNDKEMDGVKVIRVNTAEEMFNACELLFENTDIAIMAAAVADYKPGVVAAEKIKKKEGHLQLDLEPITDILKTLGARKKKGQVLVGFALETNNESANAREKLKAKNADMIVLNSMKEEGAGFGHDTNKITIFGRGGEEIGFGKKSKTEVAKDIIDVIIRLHYA
jgi:phosphopantothenoylcysteine decarboxylase/phosphopantothenate--cysteine ligase